jgi:hypothetical protein
MNRHGRTILCLAACLLYPLSTYGDWFGNALSAIEHSADHIHAPTVPPNPAARPVSTTTAPAWQPTPGTIAIQTGPSASGPFSGGATPGGRTIVGGSPAPVVRPGEVTLQIPPGGGPSSGGTITNTGSSADGASFAGHAAEGIFTAIMTGGTALTDPRRPSTGSKGRVALQPYRHVVPQQGPLREPLHREPSRQPVVMHHSLTGNANSRPGTHPPARHTTATNAIHGPFTHPGVHPMASHTTAQHHKVAFTPHPAHTVQRSVARLNHVGHPGQHRAPAHR